MKELKFNYDSPFFTGWGEDASWEHLILKDIPLYPIPKEWTINASKGETQATCVDVGANVGIFTAFWSRLFSRFICVEASKANCERMEFNFKRMGVVHALIMRRAAWSDSTGGFKLGYGSDKKRPGDCGLWTSASPHSEYEIVPTISLEDILKEAGLESVDLLKVDIEGSEYEFLYDKDLTKINNIVVELHPQACGKDKIDSLVEYIISCGFEVFERRDEQDIMKEVGSSRIGFPAYRQPDVLPALLEEVEILQKVENTETLSIGCRTILFRR